MSFQLNCKTLWWSQVKGMHQSHARNSELLWMQRVRCFEKKQAAGDKKVEGEMAQVMAHSYLWQKYNSPQCCKLVREAFDLFNELSSKSAKLQFVKEQILIRYLGLGWAKTYHPWSRNKHVFSQTELMEHFMKVVLSNTLIEERIRGWNVDKK
jgi:hypothetical protein